MNKEIFSLFLTKNSLIKLYNSLGEGEYEMYYQVYLDSFLIQEFIINFYVLKLCKLCLMSTATQKRIMFAALFTSVVQLIMICVPYPKNDLIFYFTVGVIYLIESFLTVVIAFGKAPYRSVLKRVVIYMTGLMMTGGIFMGILPRLSFYKHSKVKVLWFLIFGAFAYVLLWQFVKNRRQNTYFGKLMLVHKDKRVEGNYFLDSGNGLIESISKKPVLVASEVWLFGIFQKEDFLMRPVVYQSVGKRKGMLYAYCFDELVIYGEKRTYTYEKVWIGVCEDLLFENKNYQVIIPPDYGLFCE